MTPDWRTFLIQAGAVLAGERVQHFGDPEQERRAAAGGAVLCDLSGQGLIAAAGPDTETFLQGQLTNDVRQVTPARSQLSACCNPRGRMLASVRLFLREAVYYLRLPQETVEPLRQHLQRFILRARVTLRDASEELARIGLSGPAADDLLQEALGAAPAQVDNVVQTPGFTVIRVPGVHPRWEIYGLPAAMPPLWTLLAAKARPAGAEAWRLLDILAGVPNIYPETAEAFVPQMVNLQLINGVSFNKGCYTGQEVVARTQHLGTLKRRMYRAHIDAVPAPRPGDGLFSEELGGGAGHIVDACEGPSGGCEVLAVVAIDAAESGAVRWRGEGGPRLQLAPLPYPWGNAIR